MILEVAMLNVIPGKESQFEADFRIAGRYISSIPGYIKHSLSRCLELPSKYILHVEWQKLEDHTEGFRTSAAYVEWKKLLHHYYDPFPIVEHFEKVI